MRTRHQAARMMPPNLSRCRDCGAPIFWVITEKKRKRIWLDAKPENRFILETTSGVPVAKVIATYCTHFVTCPGMDKNRKG